MAPDTARHKPRGRYCNPPPDGTANWITAGALMAGGGPARAPRAPPPPAPEHRRPARGPPAPAPHAPRAARFLEFEKQRLGRNRVPGREDEAVAFHAVNHGQW